MRQQVRPHVPAITGLLTLVSLALVFGAAGGFIPRTAVPAAPEWLLEAIPHANIVISLAAIGTITLGWRAIRVNDVERHRVLMLASTGLFAAFLTLYLYRLIAVGGAGTFPGPETVYLYVYLPVLAIHIGLAVVCIPLVYYALLLSVTYPIAELPGTNHPRVGRAAAALWLVSFSLGVVVYLLLYRVPW